MSATDVTSPQKDGLPGTKGTLNVILHGVFTSVVDRDGTITVYIPNMGSEHVYKAGNWLAETTLQQSDFTLEGVVKAATRQTFRPDQNIALKNARISDPNCCDRVYATLHFPTPRSITSLGRLTVPPGAIAGASVGMLDPKSGGQSATVQVLTYDFSSDANLRLGDHPWEPVLDNGFVNLHVFAEADRSVEEDHIRHAFQMSMGLFTGVDLSLQLQTSPADHAAEQAEIPDGVHPFEVRGLIERQNWLTVMGRAIKEHRDLNGLWADPTAFNSEDSCTGGGASDGGGH
jgi:hypothetical protein